MTDLEMTKLCAEAMKFYISEWSHLMPPPTDAGVPVSEHGEFGWHNFDPFTDDAQAMALVKKFELTLSCEADNQVRTWYVSAGRGERCCHFNLNRAIVECVAKMQGANLELSPSS